MVYEEPDYLKMMGENIRKVRQSKSLSYRQVAAYCKIDASDISRIEKGRVNITILTLIELCKGLEVQPVEIVDWKIEFF